MLIYRLQPVGYYADDALQRTCACDLHPIARRRGGEAGFMSFLIGAAVTANGGGQVREKFWPAAASRHTGMEAKEEVPKSKLALPFSIDSILARGADPHHDDEAASDVSISSDHIKGEEGGTFGWCLLVWIGTEKILEHLHSRICCQVPEIDIKSLFWCHVGFNRFLDVWYLI